MTAGPTATPRSSSGSDFSYIHLRNVNNLLRTHHLFADNPLLPTAAYYPGLGAITAGLTRITGLSTFAAGLMVVGAARLVLSASLFHVAARVTRSERAASVACLVYMANPMFLFFGAAPSTRCSSPWPSAVRSATPTPTARSGPT